MSGFEFTHQRPTLIDDPPLTDDERAFLLQETEITEDDLTPEAYERVRVTMERSMLAADVAACADALRVDEVASLLRWSRDAVIEAVSTGKLFSVARLPRGDHLLPRWQFTDGKVLPDLASVLESLRELEKHPLGIEAWMAHEDEDGEILNGMSPQQWLAKGGDVRGVLRLIEEASWGRM
ncbi:hypothetical protein [Microbacterium sp. GXS0129]|uniref:hypothetical protein n=1 Tax=Microbacterium sp. GXS0129 TaxID=3377836 RepID=UPI00383A751E